MKIANSRKLLCFIVFYTCIFGTKIAGFFDISMVMSGCILLVNARNIIMDKRTKRMFFIIVILLFYSFFISIISGNTYISFSLRFIRVLFALAGISTYIHKTRLERDEIVNILVNVLLLHALIVVIESTVWLNLQYILKPISGFVLLPMYFRGTGLTNGYDFAGILCNFGLIIVCHTDNKTVNFKLLKIVIFFIAVMLTSRFNMLLAIGEMLFLGYIDKSADKNDRRLFRLVSWIAAIPVVGIFLFSTNNFDNFFVRILRQSDYFSRILDNLIYHYAKTNIGDTIRNHFDFSRLSFGELLFGKMIAANADPGYTQYIYAIGILGVFMVLLFYFSIINDSIKNVCDIKMKRIIVLIVLICLIMSLKNSYLLARHVTELLLILQYTGKYKCVEKKYV